MLFDKASLILVEVLVDVRIGESRFLSIGFAVVRFKELDSPLLYVFKGVEGVDELSHSLVVARLVLDRILLYVKCERNVVKDVLLLFHKRELGHHLEEP